MSFTFTVTVPGGGGGGGGGGLTGFMSTAAATQREALRAEHTIGTGEKGFTGFASRAGFTTQFVTSASALRTAMNAMSATDKVIFKCQWNGVSIPASQYIDGPSNSGMTANGAVDWGYTRPAWSAIIEPDTGFTPTIGPVSGGTDAMVFSGTHWHEFNNMTFSGDVTFSPSVGFRNGIAIVAMKNCKSTACLYASDIRTLHMDGCTTSGTPAGSFAIIDARAEYLRIWNHTATGHNNGLDFLHNFGFSQGFQSAWIAHTWLAGVKLLKMTAVTSSNHFDFHQYAINTDTHLGYHIIHEFNVINGNAEDSQGMFIAHVVPGQANAFCIHNCILTNNAFWAYAMCDPSGTQKGVIDRVLTFRAGLGPGPSTPVFDSAPWIGLYGNSLNAGGSMTITNSYFFKQASGEVQNSNYTAPVTVSGNIHVNPLLGAANGDKPSTLLTGPWTLGTNASGYTSYTSPDAAISDPVAAAAAFVAFAKPAAGWGVNAGPRDPATWPTNYDQTIT